MRQAGRHTRYLVLPLCRSVALPPSLSPPPLSLSAHPHSFGPRPSPLLPQRPISATAEELRQLCALDVRHSLTSNTREVLLACPALRRAISPISVASELVRELLAQAEAQLGRRSTSAVVTVPAYFDDSQRLATETACLLAGLERVRLLREPEAAALTFALDQKEDTRVMVFDLGGGTFDVSILDVGSGLVEVIASSGDPRLGGNDWDAAVATWLEDCFVREHATPLDGFARRRLLDAAEAAKLELSETTSTQVELPYLMGDMGLNVTLSRRKFEALTRHLVLRLVAPMQEACNMAGIDLDKSRMGTLMKGELANAAPRVQQWQQQVAWRWRRLAQRTGHSRPQGSGDLAIPISKVLLVGGATRMPCIGRFLKRVTGLTAKPTVQPDEAVALGAAVQAGVLDGRIKQKVVNPYAHERAASKLGHNVAEPLADESLTAERERGAERPPKRRSRAVRRMPWRAKGRMRTDRVPDSDASGLCGHKGEGRALSTTCCERGGRVLIAV